MCICTNRWACHVPRRDLNRCGVKASLSALTLPEKANGSYGPTADTLNFVDPRGVEELTVSGMVKAS